MLPKSTPILRGEAAKEFIEQDELPLTEKEKAFLKECLEIYRSDPVR